MIQRTSSITCPHCSAKSTEVIPENSCQFFWECPSCSKVVSPKTGDCCVFCSYGDHDCPSKTKA